MSTLKSVGNKLFKTELANHKVDLALVDEFKTAISALGSELSIQKEVYGKTIKVFSDLSNLLNDKKEREKSNDSVLNAANRKFDIATSLISKANKAASELGLNAKQITGYDELLKLGNELFDSINKLEKANNELKSIK